MRSLKIVQLISSSAVSGAERHAIDLSVKLIARGHQVSLMCPNPGWLPERAEQAGIPTQICPMKGLGWFETMKTLQRSNADIIHTHLTRAAYIGNAAGYAFHKPIVTSVHIANNDHIYRKLARGRNRLVAVSGYVAGMLKGRGVRERFVDTIYHGTDFLDRPASALDPTRVSLGVPQERQLISLIGRICEDKGQVEFLRALGELVRRGFDLHGVLVGQMAPGFKSIIEKVIDEESLRGRVSLPGIRDDVSSILDASVLAVMPSKMETFGIVALEAMARSRAVVASSAGALPEVVQHGKTGLIVHPDSPEFSEAIEYLVQDAETRNNMGANGRKLVEEHYTLEQMASQFEHTYQRCLA